MGFTRDQDQDQIRHQVGLSSYFVRHFSRQNHLTGHPFRVRASGSNVVFIRVAMYAMSVLELGQSRPVCMRLEPLVTIAENCTYVAPAIISLSSGKMTTPGYGLTLPKKTQVFCRPNSHRITLV
jgi:hypothetical protein